MLRFYEIVFRIFVYPMLLVTEFVLPEEVMYWDISPSTNAALPAFTGKCNPVLLMGVAIS